MQSPHVSVTTKFQGLLTSIHHKAERFSVKLFCFLVYAFVMMQFFRYNAKGDPSFYISVATPPSRDQKLSSTFYRTRVIF